MADNNPAKLDRDDHIPNDDPMLELTRIMGVSPEAESEPDTLGIDLEREMLGDAGEGDQVAAAVSHDVEPALHGDDVGQEAPQDIQLSEDDLELPDFSLESGELARSDEAAPDIEQQLLDEIARADSQSDDTGWDTDDQRGGELLIDDALAVAGSDDASEPELRDSLAAALSDLPPVGAITGDKASHDPVLDQMFDHGSTDDRTDTEAASTAPDTSYGAAEADFDQAPIAEIQDDGFDWPDAQEIPGGETPDHGAGEKLADDAGLPDWRADERAPAAALDNELAGLLADINDSANVDGPSDQEAYVHTASYSSEAGADEMAGSALDDAERDAPDDHFSAVKDLDGADGLSLDSELLDDELLADLDDTFLSDDTFDADQLAGQRDGDVPQPQGWERDEATHTYGEADGIETPDGALRDDLEPDDGSEQSLYPSAAVAVAGSQLASSAPWDDDVRAEHGRDERARHGADDTPDFEIHEIAEEATALDDDLAIPDFDDRVAVASPDLPAFAGEAPSASAFDDDQRPHASQQPPLQDDFESFFFEELEEADGQPVERQDRWASDGASMAAHHADTGDEGHAPLEHEVSPEAFGAATAGAAYAADVANSDRADSRKRGMLIAAVVAGVVVIGGVGAFALSSGDDLSSGSEPALVRADADPVKVKPENPGGTSVPNQDNEVYQRVAGQSADEEPAQQSLVTTAETPVDVAAKSEERVSPSQTADEPGVDGTIAAVTPRRVRTMIVRADGTLVPREEIPAETTPVATPVPGAVAAQENLATAPGQVASAISEQAPQPVAAVLPTQPATSQVQAPEAEETVNLDFPATAPRPTPRADVIAARAPQSAAVAAPQRTASTGPLVESRPAEQPITIVGQTGTQTAAAQAPAGAASTTPAAWVQISSQPSRELAQSSYANLSQRYASIIGGRGVNIVPAEIAGRGTFYRVNIPADDLRQASQMCGRIKAAGGDCLPRRQRAQ